MKSVASFVFIVSVALSCNSSTSCDVGSSSVMDSLMKDDLEYFNYLDALTNKLGLEQPMSKEAFVNVLKELDQPSYNHRELWKWCESSFPGYAGLGAETVSTEHEGELFAYYYLHQDEFTEVERALTDELFRMMSNRISKSFVAVQKDDIQTPQVNYLELNGYPSCVFEQDHIQYLMQLCLDEWKNGPLI